MGSGRQTGVVARLVTLREGVHASPHRKAQFTSLPAVLKEPEPLCHIITHLLLQREVTHDRESCFSFLSPLEGPFAFLFEYAVSTHATMRAR